MLSPNLTELAFLGASPFEEPLNGLSLPSLAKLQMFTGWYAPTWDFTRPDLFSNLTHLTLVSQDRVSAEAFIEIFNTTPLLTELFFLIAKGLYSVCDWLTFDAEKTNLPRLKALGIYTEADAYRPYENLLGDLPPSPYHSLADLASSRTQGVQRGTDFRTNLGTYEDVASLEDLVLRVGGPTDWAGVVAKRLREAVDPVVFASYGLKVSVFGSWVGSGPGRVKCLGGDPPPLTALDFKHWDEEFGGVFGGVEEYSLYPRTGEYGEL